jgi:hypothetical protein
VLGCAKTLDRANEIFCPWVHFDFCSEALTASLGEGNRCCSFALAQNLRHRFLCEPLAIGSLGIERRDRSTTPAEDGIQLCSTRPILCCTRRSDPKTTKNSVSGATRLDRLNGFFLM